MTGRRDGTAMTVDVEHEVGRRFVARMDGEAAGFLDYRLDGVVATMPHTVVEPRFEGRGIGSALVRAAVAEARAQGWAVVPACSFVADWFGRHPDDHDVLTRLG